LVNNHSFKKNTQINLNAMLIRHRLVGHYRQPCIIGSGTTNITYKYNMP